MALPVDPPMRSELVDISSTDHTFTIKEITGLWIGNTAGDVVGRLWGDSADSTWPVAANTMLPGRFKLIRKTNTTASTIRGVSGLPNDG